MDRIYAPWRYKYIKEIVSDNSDDGCLFCEVVKKQNDRENLILYRGERVYVMINRYPYNNGHLMVIPYRHIPDIDKLNDEENLEAMKFLSYSMKVLKDKFSAEGFNIGLNIGRIAGAGIDGHIHFHIVPRWNGDTNFMPVLTDTKVISQGLEESWDILKSGFDEIIKQ